jgi:hypothetical protein
MADKLLTTDLHYNKDTKTFVAEVSDLRGKSFNSVPGKVILKHGSESRVINKPTWIVDIHNPVSKTTVRFYQTEEVRDNEYELQYEAFKPRENEYSGITLKIFND